MDIQNSSIVLGASSVPEQITVMGACTIYITGDSQSQQVNPTINIDSVNGGNVVNQFEKGQIVPPPGSFIEGMGVTGVSVSVDSGSAADGPYCDADFSEETGELIMRFHNLCGGGTSGGDTGYALSLDNPNEIMLYDREGRLLTNPATCQAKLYYDGIEVTGSDIVYSIDATRGIPTGYVSSSTTDVENDTVTVYGIASDSNDAHVTIKAEYMGLEYYGKFNLLKRVGDVKYDLRVTPQDISYNITKNSASADTITVEILRTAQGDDGTMETSVMPSCSNNIRLKVDNVDRTSNYTNGAYTFSADYSKAKHYIEITQNGVFQDGEDVLFHKYSDGEQGEIGPSGSGLTNVKQYFKLSNNISESYANIDNNDPPTGWSTSSNGMIVSAQNQYLWTVFRSFWESGGKVDSGLAIIRMFQQTVDNVTQYYKASNNATGETAPASASGNPPSGTGWRTDGNNIILDSNSKYLWTFFRTTYTDNTWKDSNPAIVRFLDAQAQIDYDDIASNVSQSIMTYTSGLSQRLDTIETSSVFAEQVVNRASGSINSMVGSAVSGTYNGISQSIDALSGSINTINTSLSSTGSVMTSMKTMANDSCTSAVYQGNHVWTKTTNGTTSYQSYSYDPASTNRTAYETSMTNSGWTLALQASAMSAIKQEADKIFLGVGDGTNVAAAISILKSVPTTSAMHGTGSAIVLSADNVIINGGLAAGVVKATNIAAGAITSTHISASSIDSSHIKAKSISGSVIAAGTISGSLIAAGTISGSLISANAIDAAHIKAGAITVDKLAAGAIATNRLETGNTILGTTITDGAFNIKLNGVKRAEFGVEGSDIVLIFYDANGYPIYNLGPSGIIYNMTERTASWESMSVEMNQGNYAQFDSNHSRSGFSWQMPGPSQGWAYKYNAGFKKVGSLIKYWNPSTSAYDLDNPPEQASKWFTTANTSGTKVASGSRIFKRWASGSRHCPAVADESPYASFSMYSYTAIYTASDAGVLSLEAYSVVGWDPASSESAAEQTQFYGRVVTTVYYGNGEEED